MALLLAAAAGIWLAARSHPWQPPSHHVTFVPCRFAAGVTARCAYVQARCQAEAPPLQSGPNEGHEFACWYPVGTPEGKAALEANLAAGLPQAVSAVESVGAGA